MSAILADVLPARLGALSLRCPYRVTPATLQAKAWSVLVDQFEPLAMHVYVAAPEQ